MSKKGRDGLRASDLPGPGAYNDGDAFNHLSSANGGIKFSKASPHKAGNDIPGPGTYEQDSTLVKGKNGSNKFGKEPRDHNRNEEKRKKIPQFSTF